MTLNEFIGLSAALTGYPADVLLPSRDTQEVAAQYYAELTQPANKVNPATLDTLTSTWNSIDKTLPPPQIEVLVKKLIMGNDVMSRLAQNIIYMWYLGIWYDLAKDPNSFTTPNTDHVISSMTYKNGLVWGEMGAHPMGFSDNIFGYWEHTPQLPAIAG